MPRGKKKKAYVARSKDGKNIVAQLYVNNFRQNLDGVKTMKKYCKKARKHVELQFKEERHST